MNWICTKYLENKYSFSFDEIKQNRRMIKHKFLGENGVLEDNHYSDDVQVCGWTSQPEKKFFFRNLSSILKWEELNSFYYVKSSKGTTCYRHGTSPCESKELEIVDEIKRSDIFGIFEFCEARVDHPDADRFALPYIGLKCENRVVIAGQILSERESQVFLNLR